MAWATKAIFTFMSISGVEKLGVDEIKER